MQKHKDALIHANQRVGIEGPELYPSDSRHRGKRRSAVTGRGKIGKAHFNEYKNKAEYIKIAGPL